MDKNILEERDEPWEAYDQLPDNWRIGEEAIAERCEEIRLNREDPGRYDLPFSKRQLDGPSMEPRASWQSFGSGRYRKYKLPKS